MLIIVKEKSKYFDNEHGHIFCRYLYFQYKIVTSKSKGNDAKCIPHTENPSSLWLSPWWLIGHIINPTLVNRHNPYKRTVTYGCDSSYERNPCNWIKVWKLSKQNGSHSKYQIPLYGFELV